MHGTLLRSWGHCGFGVTVIFMQTLINRQQICPQKLKSKQTMGHRFWSEVPSSKLPNPPNTDVEGNSLTLTPLRDHICFCVF